MKKTGYVAFGAIIAALCCVTMLVSYFPYLTYSVPALAGLFIMVAVVEIGVKWAFFSFFASSFIVLLTAEPEAALLYVCLFGCYPIIKALIEKISLTALKYIVKLLVFNASVVLVYVVFMKLFGISTGLEGVAAYGVYALWAFANVVFLIYDLAIFRVSQWYIFRLHSRVSSLIKNKR